MQPEGKVNPGMGDDDDKAGEVVAGGKSTGSIMILVVVFVPKPGGAFMGGVKPGGGHKPTAWEGAKGGLRGFKVEPVLLAVAGGEERPRLLFSSKKLVMNAVQLDEGTTEASLLSHKLSTIAGGGTLERGACVLERDSTFGGAEICGAKVVVQCVCFVLRGARGCAPLGFFRIPFVVVLVPSSISSLLLLVAAGFKASHRLTTTGTAFFALALCSDLRLRVVVAVFAVRGV